MLAGTVQAMASSFNVPPRYFTFFIGASIYVIFFNIIFSYFTTQQNLTFLFPQYTISLHLVIWWKLIWSLQHEKYLVMCSSYLLQTDLLEHIFSVIIEEALWYVDIFFLFAYCVSISVVTNNGTLFVKHLFLHNIQLWGTGGSTSRFSSH